MRRHLGLIVLIATTSIASAAEPITLVCSGQMWAPQHNIDGRDLPPQSLIVDFDSKEVRGSLGRFTLTETSDSHISFEAQYNQNGERRVTSGRLDRISGFASLTQGRAGETSFSTVYQLKCTHTPRLF